MGRLERALIATRQREAMFREIAEQASDIISRHAPDGVCTYVSPAVTVVLGYDPDELEGRNLGDLIHPQDLPAFAAEVEALRAGAEPRTVRYRFRSKRTGGYVWFETKLRAIRDALGSLDGFHAVAREITARKRAEDALRESEARFRLLAEHASDVISRTTADGRILYVSPSCEQVLGYRPEELLGRLAQDLIEPDDFPGAAEARATLLETGEGTPVTHRLRHRDGRAVWVETTRHVLRDDNTGEVIEIQAVSRDVSSRVRAEREARELNAMKSDFVALVSHELRAPLTNMVGSIELLRHDASRMPEGAQRTLGVLATQTARLQRLVETVLDVSRLDAGELPLTLGPAPIDVAVRQALEMFAGETHAPIDVAIEPGLPFAWADETYLTQVIANVIENAIKYGAPPIVVRARSRPPDIEISVTDAGPGIAPPERERLFEAFFRGADSGVARGYGLGMYLARRLLERQGGSIEVDSPAHEDAARPGARFTITLPAARGEP
jgi:PAS domain S-box-containing protein